MHKTLAGTETGLVGYWQFKRNDGTSAADSVKTAGHTGACRYADGSIRGAEFDLRGAESATPLRAREV